MPTKRTPNWTPFNKNEREEGKTVSGGKSSQTTHSGTHLVNIKNAAKQMPKKQVSMQRKGNKRGK